MTNHTIDSDIRVLTEGLKSPVDKRVMLRPSLTAALFRLGYAEQEIDSALDRYYAQIRTVH